MLSLAYECCSVPDRPFIRQRRYDCSTESELERGSHAFQEAMTDQREVIVPALF